jgi:hypothetical protein
MQNVFKLNAIMSNVMVHAKSEALSDLNVTNFEIDFKVFYKIDEEVYDSQGNTIFHANWRWVGASWHTVAYTTILCNLK